MYFTVRSLTLLLHGFASSNTDQRPGAAMSTCTRCGAEFGCAMADGSDAPCWCTQLPPVVPVPGAQAGCWCPACLRAHIEAQQPNSAEVPAARLK
jgi:hypothetical protein